MLIDDCRLGIGDCKIGSLGCGLDRGRIRFMFRIVREFCFVKCGAREIPAYAGMTWEGAGMAWLVGDGCS